jgi:hypothetical protein
MWDEKSLFGALCVSALLTFLGTAAQDANKSERAFLRNWSGQSAIRQINSTETLVSDAQAFGFSPLTKRVK